MDSYHITYLFTIEENEEQYNRYACEHRSKKCANPEMMQSPLNVCYNWRQHCVRHTLIVLFANVNHSQNHTPHNVVQMKKKSCWWTNPKPHIAYRGPSEKEIMLMNKPETTHCTAWSKWKRNHVDKQTRNHTLHSVVQVKKKSCW